MPLKWSKNRVSTQFVVYGIYDILTTYDKIVDNFVVAFKRCQFVATVVACAQLWIASYFNLNILHIKIYCITTKTLKFYHPFRMYFIVMQHYEVWH